MCSASFVLSADCLHACNKSSLKRYWSILCLQTETRTLPMPNIDPLHTNASALMNSHLFVEITLPLIWATYLSHCDHLEMKVWMTFLILLSPWKYFYMGVCLPLLMWNFASVGDCLWRPICNIYEILAVIIYNLVNKSNPLLFSDVNF